QAQEEILELIEFLNEDEDECVASISDNLEDVLSQINNNNLNNEIELFLNSENYSCDAYSAALSMADSLTDDSNFEDYEVPPSCDSFNFENSLGYWQQAAVKNIRFKVVVLSPQGAHINFSILYPSPILFGMPSNMTNGGNISNGLAAELSAQALK